MKLDQKTITKTLADDITASREVIRQTKPLVYDKLMNFLDRQNKGLFPRVSLLDWAYSFDCNFQCKHCGTSLLGKNREIHPSKMSMDMVRRVADQAHDIGFFTISFLGGEPLLWPELDTLVSTVGPERFFITVLTNGWLLTGTRAKELARHGVNKIGISIDSGIEAEHDRFRNKKGAFAKAMNAVDNAMSAGLRVHVSTTVTHQNIKSEGIRKLLDMTHEKQISIDLQCATVAGKWQDNFDALLDEGDVVYISELRQAYPLIRRDLLPTPGCRGGCPALTGSVFLISSGDVLPCLFIHLALGNVYQEPLKDILFKGKNFTELTAYSNRCLAGEDLGFIEKYLKRTFGQPNLPLSWEEGFGKILRPGMMK